MSRLEYLDHDPIPALLESEDAALTFFVRRDLLGEEAGDVAEEVWTLPQVAKLLRRQRPDGAWRPTGALQAKYPHVNYALIETWKQLRFAVEQYEMDRRQPAVERAAEFVFSCQTDEGDIRGFLANQAAMYYTGALLSLLIRAGYTDDPRTARGLAWLLDSRQDDGGWVANRVMSLGPLPWADSVDLSSQDLPTVTEHDRTRPSSHNWTGMVIRAFVAHPKWRQREETLAAARFLKSRFFEKDCYTSYQAADHWVRFQFPFWWNHLVAALDSLSRIGIRPEDPDIARGLEWLVRHQEKSGLWRSSYSHIHRAPGDSPKALAERRWITLAICRIFARMHSDVPDRC